jgi:hypothetical protein
LSITPEACPILWCASQDDRQVQLLPGGRAGVLEAAGKLVGAAAQMPGIGLADGSAQGVVAFNAVTVATITACATDSLITVVVEATIGNDPGNGHKGVDSYVFIALMGAVPVWPIHNGWDVALGDVGIGIGDAR